jgi:hypothetical protein
MVAVGSLQELQVWSSAKKQHINPHLEDSTNWSPQNSHFSPNKIAFTKSFRGSWEVVTGKREINL